MKKQTKVFRSFKDLTRKALPADFARRCDRRTAEAGADKPVTRKQEKALAAELLVVFTS